MQKLLFIFLTVLFSVGLQAQQVSLNTIYFPGVAYNGGGGLFYGGFGQEITYQHDIGKHRFRGGLEYRSVDWGNQIALNTAFNPTYLRKGQFRVSGTTNLQLGFALFRQNPLFVWALEYSPELEWQSNKRFFANFSLGFRYTNSPKYKDYGNINAVWELPLKLGWGFRFGNLNKAY